MSYQFRNSRTTTYTRVKVREALASDNPNIEPLSNWDFGVMATLVH